MPNGPMISADEWLAYVATDSQLKLIPGRTNSHGVIVELPPGYRSRDLDWNSHSGSICANKPDAAMLAKMLQIAVALRAKVQGEDLEVYEMADLSDGFVAGRSARGVDISEPRAAS